MIRRLFHGAWYRFLYRTAVGQAVLDRVQRPTQFYDGRTHRVPFRVHRMFRLWQYEMPSLARESRLAFNAYKGGDFIDVGAFNGWYSLLLAPKAQPGNSFISVEPDRSCAATLLKILATLRRIYPRVSFRLIDRAIGDGSPVDIVAPEGKAGHPSFRSVTDNNSAAAQRSLTVDELTRTHHLRPSFIKVDVEGAEYEVLLGAEKTLKEFHPILMTELHPDWLSKEVTVENIVEYLQRLGYSSKPIDDVHLIWE